MPRRDDSIHSGGEPVEIVDDTDRPLGVMPLPEAQRQALGHRTVLVLLYDGAGRVCLQRRADAKALYPGRWDLSCTGHVRAGESREDAALRELFEELGVRAPRLARTAEVEAGPETGHSFVTLYSAGGFSGIIVPDPAEVQEISFLDRDELEALVEGFREMLTPALVHFWERGLIFPGGEAPGAKRRATSPPEPP